MLQDKKITSSRRSALKTLALSGVAAGATVNKSWVKPVVQSVILPAHAQTSSDFKGPLTDPCSVDVICESNGTVTAEVSGQVVGAGNVGDITIEVVCKLGGTEKTETTTTNSNGEWSASVNFGSPPDAGTVEVEATAPDLQFVGTTRCSGSYDCSEGEDGCNDCKWDKSSLEFSGVEVCNTGDGPSKCPTKYEIWFASRGNPKHGRMIEGGTIGPLGYNGCHDFSSQLEARCEEADFQGGRFKVRAFQHPYHGAPNSDCSNTPINHDLWSDTWDCPSE